MADNRKSLTKDFCHTLCKFMYLGMGKRVWIGDLGYPETFTKIYDVISKYVVNAIIYILIVMEWASYFTQPHLTEKQAADRLLFTLSHVLFQVIIVNFGNHANNIKNLFHVMLVELEEILYDKTTAKTLITRMKIIFGLVLFYCSMSLVMYGVDGIAKCRSTGETFVTVVTAWPDVRDTSLVAGFSRIVIYIIWWIYLIQILTVYIMQIAMLIFISHLIRNLQTYFYNLNAIFDREDLNQKQKEEDYEKMLKNGFRIHSLILDCIKQVQEICNVFCSCQIILNTTMLGVILNQILTVERSLTTMLALAVILLSILTSTGLVMGSAGDITYEVEYIFRPTIKKEYNKLLKDFGLSTESEWIQNFPLKKPLSSCIKRDKLASHLPTAMYSSGWQNCQHEAAVRVKRLLLISVSRCQTPIELRCLGLIKLSYASYVTIVKSSYSVFSVLF